MIIDRIVVSASPGEVRIAELCNGKLACLTLDREYNKSRVGNVYLGRVEAVIHSLQAAFVEIGDVRHGFLALPEVRPHSELNNAENIQHYLSEGDQVLVQVLRDREGGKGAKLTMRIGLSGRDLVFLPQGEGVSISRRLDDKNDRNRLKVHMEKFVSDGEGGFIVRSAAAEADEKNLEVEVDRLRCCWLDIVSRKEKETAPSQLFEDIEPACRPLREHGGSALRNIVVDDENLFASMCAFAETEAPDLLGIITKYTGVNPLFDEEGIEDMIEAALDPVVSLASGGNLVISEMPALTAIDVNTGSTDYGTWENTAFKVNKEAAHEIAKQIRLRNLSGTLVIDFVSMRRHDNRQKLNEVFRRVLADDPLNPSLIGFTRMGLAELTRRRQRGSLFELICGGTPLPEPSATSTALAALRAVIRHSNIEPASGYTIEAHAEVIAVLKNYYSKAFYETRRRLGGNLELIPTDSVTRSIFDVHSICKVRPNE